MRGKCRCIARDCSARKPALPPIPVQPNRQRFKFGEKIAIEIRRAAPRFVGIHLFRFHNSHCIADFEFVTIAV
jgi:hypothetical protein